MSSSAPLTPRFQAMARISERLTGAGIHHALGGSGLLHCLGCPIEPSDWDLLTDAPLAAARRALDGETYECFGPSSRYPSAFLLKIESGNCWIELIGSFAIHTPSALVEVPTRVSDYYRGVPLGDPSDWLVAYRAIAQASHDRASRDRFKIDWLQTFLG